MKKIRNIENIINVFPTWRPADVSFIRSLEWSIDGLIIVFYFQLRSNVSGWPDLSQPFFKISIAFKNVRELKLDFGNAGLQQVAGFDIIDISDNSLDRVNFQVEDYENGIINFCCEEIVINDRPLEEKL